MAKTASRIASSPKESPARTAGPAHPRPTVAQRRYLEKGLGEPGGKLPLFDVEGQEIPRKTIESCIEHGWATPWFENPVKPDWLVCRLTEKGYNVLARKGGSSAG